MTEAAKRAKAAYLKKWKAEHPEKQKEYIARYWERKGKALEEQEQQAGSSQGKRQPRTVK